MKLLDNRSVYGLNRRSPHGERGLKCGGLVGLRARRRRSPHGERGLKYTQNGRQTQDLKSLSSWRAWIEINLRMRIAGSNRVALLMESVD